MNIYEKIDEMSKDEKNTIKHIISKKLLNMFLTGEFKSEKDFSKECFVSEATVTRFAKETGCSGYRELIFKLKLEYEKTILKAKEEIKKNKINKELETIKSMNNWVNQSKSFLDSLIKNILLQKKIKILSSWQNLDSVSYFQKVLQEQNISSQVVKIELDYLDLESYFDDNKCIKLIIISESDFKNLASLYIKKIINKKIKNTYLITTYFKFNKIYDNNYQNKHLLSFNYDDSHHVLRHFALINLFFYLNLKINKKLYK
ncbi:MurR/RpiR family transcriptional regulator [Spiroplasma gladiatoris]|uniref:MurR/RpiR family transcriptional regulator n=1 Tax=Spiroplasma gladiatoris TaxID=2143 RepID=A0A4P7AHA8_9MOLU|nr:hypothetical protein [Spiroplasma gladiatoris]QBQ07834.1 MurR/RpiR family transcriptional regulator [Spiroplasma gladiatoris]